MHRQEAEPDALGAALGSVARHLGLAPEATVGCGPAAHDPLQARLQGAVPDLTR